MKERRARSPYVPRYTYNRICGAHGRQRGEPCAKPAGWGTAHVGVGRCRLHGGVKKHGDRRLRTGRHSAPIRLKFEELLRHVEAEKVAKPELLKELATLRALSRWLLERPPARFSLDAWLRVQDKVIAAVSVQQRISRGGMVRLTAVQRHLETIGLVLAKHIKDPDVLRAIEGEAKDIPIMEAQHGRQ